MESVSYAKPACSADTQNSTGEIRPFDDYLRSQVASSPESVAIVQNDRQWTYADLDEATNRISASLIRDRVEPGQCVGVCLPRCPEAIASMLAIHRAGAAFVPLDPEYPSDRLEFMISDADIRLVISDAASIQATSPISKRPNGEADDAQSHKVNWSDVQDRLQFEPSEPTAFPRLDGRDLAYVMYTSGSTGKPKGVQIDHAALTTYCLADAEVYQLTPADRTLQFSTLNFDIAIEEIFPPLMTGGAIVVRPPERSASRNELSDLVDRFHITAIHLATAYWHEWVDLIAKSNSRVPHSIRLMVVTGEKVSVQHYHRWQQHCDQTALWCNAYGPTEATVTATVFVPDPSFDAQNMPIGRPLPGYTAYILDDQLREVTKDQTGQLFIGGPALAKGYLNRPERTAAAFIDWPGNTNHPPQRLYSTGDIARWLPDGQIDFGGRIDHQIKLGSYRIEPAEIEAALNDHVAIAESLVTYDEVNGQKFLVAYLATDQRPASPASIADWLRDRLPPYMVPHRYVVLDEFPKTINGKIDREALPPASTAQVARRDDYVAPSNEIETELAILWSDTLNVPCVGIHDDFFQLGGSSLLVTRIVAAVTDRWNIELPVRDFFANPTIELMAAHMQHLISQQNGDPHCNAGASDANERISSIRDRLPEIRPSFFTSTDESLFSVHYPPHGKLNRKHGVVICGSYGQEHTRGYRNLQQLATRLAQHGFDVLRFDYANSGHSSGSCDQMTAARMTVNIADACRRLRAVSRCQQLSIVGLRAGATLACQQPIDDISSIVLWDPVVNGLAFVDLIKQFHQHAVTGLHRFPKKRTMHAAGQAFGYSLPKAKSDSFATMLNLPPESHVAAMRSLLIASDQYLRHERDSRGVVSSWTVEEIEDQILWHDPNYTQAAFSSPEAFNRITEFLIDGCNDLDNKGTVR